jgi:hypothetical protein
MTMTKCVIWHKSKNDRGYGQEFFRGKNTKAHRAEWIRANGEIPEGYVLDHTCHNEAAKAGKCEGGYTCEHRACVNLDHLRLVSPSENVLAGNHSIDTKANCPQGHSYKDERNIMVRKNGKRECAECNRQRAAANYLLSKVG